MSVAKRGFAAPKSLQMAHRALAVVLLGIQNASRAQLRLDGVRAFRDARIRARRLQEIALRLGEPSQVIERLAAIVRLAAQIVEIALGVLDALLRHREERQRASGFGQPRVVREDLVEPRLGLARPPRREQQLGVLELHLDLVVPAREVRGDREGVFRSARDEQRARVQQLRLDPVGVRLAGRLRVLEGELEVPGAQRETSERVLARGHVRERLVQRAHDRSRGARVRLVAERFEHEREAGPAIVRSSA